MSKTCITDTKHQEFSEEEKEIEKEEKNNTIGTTLTF